MKGIKAIIGVFAAASLFISMNGYAQENANRDENNNIVRGPYETNRLWDNVFIGGAIGVNGSHSHLFWVAPEWFKGYGFATDIYVGKWITPAVGLRAGLSGLNNYNVRGSFFDKADTFSGHYAYNTIHFDVLWNAFNSIWGYKETRFWNLDPYFSMAVASIGTLESKTGGILHRVLGNIEYEAGFGLYNTFRINDRLNATADLRGMVGKGAAYVGDNAKFVYLHSLLLGVSYTFGETGFHRHSSITPAIIPVPFTTQQYEDLSDKVAALEKENAELKDKVAALEKEVAPLRQLVNGQTYLFENGTFTAVDTKAGAPLTLYFDCGSATLSAREKAHLEYFLDNVLGENSKLAVNGYADKQTGSARRNQQLSEQRVKTVVNLLKKAGAKEENIETAAHGASIQLFKGAAKNRVVTIEVK